MVSQWMNPNMEKKNMIVRINLFGSKREREHRKSHSEDKIQKIIQSNANIQSHCCFVCLCSESDIANLSSLKYSIRLQDAQKNIFF